MDNTIWSDEQALAYIASHPDLAVSYGDDADAGRIHYARYGLAEGRAITFDPIAYADTAGIPGMSRAEMAARHYIRSITDSTRRSEELLPQQRFPASYHPPGEAGTSYRARAASGFLDRYCSGDRVLDVGFSGYDNPHRLTALPGAIGVDLDYPGYDGISLPFADMSVDTVFSSHCLEHIERDQDAIRDWYRVLKVGGFLVCMVPSQALYEKKRDLPSRWNADHKRMYTPASLMASFERALTVNSYRLRHLRENEGNYDYAIPADQHANSPYEIELVIERIQPPEWELS